MPKRKAAKFTTRDQISEARFRLWAVARITGSAKAIPKSYAEREKELLEWLFLKIRSVFLEPVKKSKAEVKTEKTAFIDHILAGLKDSRNPFDRAREWLECPLLRVDPSSSGKKQIFFLPVTRIDNADAAPSFLGNIDSIKWFEQPISMLSGTLSGHQSSSSAEAQSRKGESVQKKPISFINLLLPWTRTALDEFDREVIRRHIESIIALEPSFSGMPDPIESSQIKKSEALRKVRTLWSALDRFEGGEIAGNIPGISIPPGPRPQLRSVVYCKGTVTYGPKKVRLSSRIEVFLELLLRHNLDIDSRMGANGRNGESPKASSERKTFLRDMKIAFPDDWSTVMKSLIRQRGNQFEAGPSLVAAKIDLNTATTESEKINIGKRKFQQARRQRDSFEPRDPNEN